MIEEILKKAGLIDYERLVKIMLNTCKLSKLNMPSQVELIDMLVNKYCYINKESGMIICKSDIKYDFTLDKRKVALREYVINSL